MAAGVEVVAAVGTGAGVVGGVTGVVGRGGVGATGEGATGGTTGAGATGLGVCTGACDDSSGLGVGDVGALGAAGTSCWRCGICCPGACGVAVRAEGCGSVKRSAGMSSMATSV